MAPANGGRLDRPTGFLGMVHVLAHGEGEAARQSRTSSLAKPGPQPQRNSTPIASAPWSELSALRCVALRGDTASQPVSIDGAPLGRIGTASARSAQHCAGSFRYLTPKKGKAGYQVSNKPFGSGGHTRRCDTRHHVISFPQTVRGDPVACAPSLKP